MTEPSICLILPCYNDLPYVKRCLETFFAYTPGGWACVTDDATPGLTGDEWLAMFRSLPAGPNGCVQSRFTENRGLTHGWNHGLRQARALRVDYAVCGNSDTLFTRDWWEPMVDALQHYDLVGPVTNAPGWGCGDLQDVKRYFPQYRLTDDQEYLDRVSDELRPKYAPVPLEPSTLETSALGCSLWVAQILNGFTLMARTETWWANAWGKEEVFDPHMPMQHNELELQIRWAAAGRTRAVVPGSFIFHYRSVARGDQYRTPGSYRMQENAE